MTGIVVTRLFKAAWKMHKALLIGQINVIRSWDYLPTPLPPEGGAPLAFRRGAGGEVLDCFAASGSQ